MHVRSITSKSFRGVAAAGAALSLFVVSGSVFAATASTPVGQITANQAAGPCNDLGAVVNVSVSGGFASKLYTVNAVHVLNGPASFTSNGSGTGSASLVNVAPDAGGTTGNATLTVTANNKTGTVVVPISCSSGKGD